MVKSWRKVNITCPRPAVAYYSRLIGTWPSRTVSQYVPAVGKVLGADEKEDESSREGSKVPGPPERPHHDTQIEEFIKDQHVSKTDDGTLT